MGLGEGGGNHEILGLHVDPQEFYGKDIDVGEHRVGYTGRPRPVDLIRGDTDLSLQHRVSGYQVVHGVDIGLGLPADGRAAGRRRAGGSLYGRGLALG